MGKIVDEVNFLTLDQGARKCAAYIEQLEQQITDCCEEEGVRARSFRGQLDNAVNSAQARLDEGLSAVRAEIAEVHKAIGELRSQIAAHTKPAAS